MTMNWDDYRYFLAIAEARSLTGAGRALGVSQPTVSRRLEAIEGRLKVRLFERTQQGYEMTPAALEIFRTIERVGDDLNDMERKLFGQDRELAGGLRITCTEVLLNAYLAPHLWRFLATHPGIALGIVSTDAQLSLSRHDADLAIRFTAQPPDTLIGRRLAKAAFGVYEQHHERAKGDQGRTEGRASLAAADWIGWHDEVYNRLFITGTFPEARIKHRVDSAFAMQAMVRQGLGVAVLPCYTTDPDPGLQRILPELLTEGMPDLWLLHHPDVRQVARISLFASFVAEIVAADRDLFEGRRPCGERP